jgi:hypothetical protein
VGQWGSGADGNIAEAIRWMNIMTKPCWALRGGDSPSHSVILGEHRIWTIMMGSNARTKNAIRHRF